MSNKSIFAASAVFVLLVVGMFVFAYLKQAEAPTESIAPIATTTAAVSLYDNITQVTAKHFFGNGVHTIAGEILMPTPCDLLNWDTRIAESAPEQVVVDFTVINEAESCATVITPQRFLVSFTAAEAAQISATFQGRSIQLNLLPAAAGETPDQFEIFEKG